MASAVQTTNFIGFQFISGISSYVIKSSTAVVSHSIAHIRSQMSPDRILQISLLGLSSLGLGASLSKKSFGAATIFGGVLLLQIILLSKTHDYFFLQKKFTELTVELEGKKGLSEELSKCTQKVHELVSSLDLESAEKKALAEQLTSYSVHIQELVQKLDGLQQKMNIFEETRMDVTKIVELLFQAKTENEGLKKSLESKMDSIGGHADRLASSAERIESGLGKVDNSFDLMQETAEKIALLSTKLDDLLKKTSTP